MHKMSSVILWHCLIVDDKKLAILRWSIKLPDSLTSAIFFFFTIKIYFKTNIWYLLFSSRSHFNSGHIAVFQQILTRVNIILIFVLADFSSGVKLWQHTDMAIDCILFLFLMIQYCYTIKYFSVNMQEHYLCFITLASYQTNAENES